MFFFFLIFKCDSILNCSTLFPFQVSITYTLGFIYLIYTHHCKQQELLKKTPQHNTRFYVNINRLTEKRKYWTSHINQVKKRYWKKPNLKRYSALLLLKLYLVRTRLIFLCATLKPMKPCMKGCFIMTLEILPDMNKINLHVKCELLVDCSIKHIARRNKQKKKIEKLKME